MENKPEFRIVGNVPEEEKEAAKEELLRRLFDNFKELPPGIQDQLHRLEYPKSEKEAVLIDFANKFTNNLMIKLGAIPYDIPSENYRIVPPELYKEFMNSSDESEAGSACYTRQGLLLNAKYSRKALLEFGATALHETMHLKGELAQEVRERDGDNQKSIFAIGITAGASQKMDNDNMGHAHHEGLNEAIVTATEKMGYQEILRLPGLAEEKKWMESKKAKEIIKKIATRANVPEDEFMFVDKKSKEASRFAYYHQRRTLNLLCEEIQKDNPDKYKSTDEVFEEFLRAHFTGKKITIAKLVDRSFGEGGFRILGNMDDTNQSGVLHYETMKMLRRKHLKSK